MYSRQAETEIVWNDIPLHYPYLREVIVAHAWSRTAPMKKFGSRRIIGYVKIAAEVPCAQGRCARRAWIWDDKSDPYPEDDKPCEAVTPSSIKVREESHYGRERIQAL